MPEPFPLPPGGLVAPACSATKKSGEPCRAAPVPGTDRCRFHPADEAAREAFLEMSARGGARAGSRPLPHAPPMGTANPAELETAAGLRTFLARTIARLAELPFDARVANSVAQLVTAQRALIETSDLEARLAQLEAAARGDLRLVG